MKRYEAALIQMCKDNAFENYYELIYLIEQEDASTFVALGIPEENDEEADANDGSDTEGDDDATKE